MHHGSHIYKHGLIEGRNRASDEALLNNNAMAEDHSVKNAAKLYHGVLEFLLDPLRLSQIKCLNVQHVLHAWLSPLQIFLYLWVEVFTVSYHQDELA